MSHSTDDSACDMISTGSTSDTNSDYNMDVSDTRKRRRSL